MSKQATLRLSTEDDLIAFREFKDKYFAGLTNSQVLLTLINTLKLNITEDVPMRTENVIIRLTNKDTLTNFQELKDKMSEINQQRYTNDTFQQLLLDSFMAHELNPKVDDSVSVLKDKLADIANDISIFRYLYKDLNLRVSRIEDKI